MCSAGCSASSTPWCWAAILLGSLGALASCSPTPTSGSRSLAVGAGIPAHRADRLARPAAGRPRLGSGRRSGCARRVELLSALDLLADASRNTLERLAAAAEQVVCLPAAW